MAFSTECFQSFLCEMCLFSLVMGSGIKSQAFSPLGFRVLVTKIHIGCWGSGTIFQDRVGFPPGIWIRITISHIDGGE